MNKLARILAVTSIISIMLAGVLMPVEKTYADGLVIVSDTQYPDVATTVARAPHDDIDWGNIDFIKTDTGQYDLSSYCGCQNGNLYSYLVKASDFGFSLPANTTIFGIEVEIRKDGAHSNPPGVPFDSNIAKDEIIQLSKDNSTEVGDNEKSDDWWPVYGTIVTYGGEDDLWGTTWTSEEINDANFSIHIAGKSYHNDVLYRIGWVRITVYYEAPIEFSDIALDTAMHTATGADPMYLSDVEALTSFTGSSLAIANISGMENCTNISTLYLNDNSIIPLSPLEGLTNMVYLNLSDNDIGNISPLSELINLSELNLCGNNISDTSPLSGLVNLSTLKLCENNIVDISPLSGLVNLSTLNLCDNNISDISSLSGLVNLSTLGLCGNNISDISPLAGLDNLSTIDLSDNDISDISPLVGNPNISGNISLDNNPLDAKSYYEYIPELESRGITVTYEGVTAPKLMIQPNINVMMTIQALIFMLGGTMGILALLFKGDSLSTGIRLGLLVGLAILTIIGIAMLESVIVAVKWM